MPLDVIYHLHTAEYVALMVINHKYARAADYRITCPIESRLCTYFINLE